MAQHTFEDNQYIEHIAVDESDRIALKFLSLKTAQQFNLALKCQKNFNGDPEIQFDEKTMVQSHRKDSYSLSQTIKLLTETPIYSASMDPAKSIISSQEATSALDALTQKRAHGGENKTKQL